MKVIYPFDFTVSQVVLERKLEDYVFSVRPIGQGSHPKNAQTWLVPVQDIFSPGFQLSRLASLQIST